MEFDWIYRHADGSTTLKLDGKYSLIEADYTLFKHQGIVEFSYIDRNSDGSTKMLIEGKQVLVELNGALFEYDGITEFDYIYRLSDGSTKLGIDSNMIIVPKENKQMEYVLIDHMGERRAIPKKKNIFRGNDYEFTSIQTREMSNEELAAWLRGE